MVLIGIGFLAGVITALSPCVLPVLPILLAGGASGGRRRPYAIIAGLVTSFVVFTLAAAWLLDLLGLPRDVLRNVALILLFVVAATLLVPRLAGLLERPFLILTRRRAGDLGGGVMLGLSLGLVFVPCAGPVLAYISVRAASEELNGRAVALLIAYALGAAGPMLLVALGGQRFARTIRSRALRPALGLVVAVAAVGIALNLDVKAQAAIGGYTESLQEWLERSDAARRGLGSPQTGSASGGLDDFGRAPEFAGISTWLNTPGGRPLSMAGLRGKVVLVDFWTYSCVNCLRTLPYVREWDRRYRKNGLVIVGVHSPEFAFESELDNVRGAVSRLDVGYPVALDNDFETWGAFANQYWPAKYLIDRKGRVRYAHFGEGEYERTEGLIRRLLAAPSRKLPSRSELADAGMRTGLVTPESYLGYRRLDRYAGSEVEPDAEADYRFPADLSQNELAYEGRWRVEGERIASGAQARLRLRFRARDVHLVLGGNGRVRVFIDGVPQRPVDVREHRLYTLVEGRKLGDALLELRFDPGIEAYAFTFG